MENLGKSLNTGEIFPIEIELLLDLTRCRLVGFDFEGDDVTGAGAGIQVGAGEDVAEAAAAQIPEKSVSSGSTGTKLEFRVWSGHDDVINVLAREEGFNELVKHRHTEKIHETLLSLSIPED